MADDDDDFDDDEEEDALGEEVDGSADDDLGGGDDDGSSSSGPVTWKTWLNTKRGWMLIAILAVIQGLFAFIMIRMRSQARPVEQVTVEQVRALAIEMLGYEVKFGQIYQTLPLRGGKHMTVGLDLVLVLGQLPEEQIEGAPRPNPQEFALFTQAAKDIEDRIRSRMNIILQQIPVSEYGSTDVYRRIKDEIKTYANDVLAGLDFGKNLRPGINKRRVTDVLLPMFIRQML